MLQKTFTVSLAELQKIGLVKKIIAKPNRHYALHIEKGFEIIIEQRNHQTKLLEKTISQVKRNFNRKLRQNVNDSGNFILISKEKPIKSRAKRMLETAQESIDLKNDASEDRPRNYIFPRKKLDEGVKIRDILSKNPGLAC